MPTLIILEMNPQWFQTFTALALAQGASQAMYDNPSSYASTYKKALEEALPADILQTLINMRGLGNPGFVHLKNLPQDPIIPEGASATQRNQQKTRVSEALIIGMAALLDCHLGEGAIHQVSVASHQTQLSAKRDPLYYHIETAYAKHVPRFLMFVGLEADIHAQTTYFFISDMLKDIPPSIMVSMRKPIFHISAVAGHDGDQNTVCALLATDHAGIETFRFYEAVDRFTPAPLLDDASRIEAENCLMYLTSHAEKVFAHTHQTQAIALNPGEALLFNNGWSINKIHHGIMHGRNGYVRNPNRWMQRGIFYFNNADQQGINNEH